MESKRVYSTDYNSMRMLVGTVIRIRNKRERREDSSS